MYKFYLPRYTIGSTENYSLTNFSSLITGPDDDRDVKHEKQTSPFQSGKSIICC